jgi:predicted metalloprotease with PDZ domain
MPVSRRAPLRYRIAWRQPNDHLFDIEIGFTASRRDPELMLPAWRPGRYLRQNYAANVRQWEARGTGGASLPIEKIAPSAWRVRADRAEAVTVRYRYFAGVLDAGSSFLDETEAYFNGSNLFMMVVDQRQHPILLDIAAPSSWSVETQLPPQGGIWRARHYDHLIDSPTIVSPSIRRHSFQQSGAQIDLVFQSAQGMDTAQFVDPVRKIVRTQAELFGGLPLRHYRFLYHVGDRWHGVEHEDSCSIILRSSDVGAAQPGSDGHDHLLSITAHEFFHLWNVKRIVPERFHPYDYAAETPTRLLWVMEGITSYYGGLTLVRSGLWNATRYLKHLSGEITTLESSPGREFLSLSQASFDGWLQDPSQMHDKPNAWISFYNKGEVVSALLDLEIRRRSRGRHTLDAVMRTLWHEYGKKRRGLPEDGLKKAVERVAGRDFGHFFRRFIDGVEPLPYEDLLATAGVEYVRKPKNPDQFSLAVTAERREGQLVVQAVVAGGPAALAGLLPNDEIIGVGETRVSSAADLERVLRRVGRNRTSIMIARNQQIITRDVTPIEDRTITVELQTVAGATTTQKRRLKEWLGATT